MTDFGTELSYGRVSPVGSFRPKTVIPSKADTPPLIRDMGWFAGWLIARTETKDAQICRARGVSGFALDSRHSTSPDWRYFCRETACKRKGAEAFRHPPLKDAITVWSGGDGNLSTARGDTDETETGDQHCPASGFGHGARNGDYLNASRARKVADTTQTR